MAQGIEGITGSNRNAIQPQAELQRREKAREEFVAMFYKELLKNVFKAPSLGLAEEDENSPTQAMTSMIGSDIFLEKMARELARSQALREGIPILNDDGKKE